MITQYVEQALQRAEYERIDDEAWAATVPKLRGVIAMGSSFEACRRQLAQVVEEWIFMRIASGLVVPALGGVTIRIRRRH